MDKIRIKKKTKSEVSRNILKYLKKNKIIEVGGGNVSEEDDDEDSYGRLSISSNEELPLSNQQIIISRLKNKIKFLENEIKILDNKLLIE